MRGNEPGTKVTLVQSDQPGRGCLGTVVHGWFVCEPGRRPGRSLSEPSRSLSPSQAWEAGRSAGLRSRCGRSGPWLAGWAPSRRERWAARIECPSPCGHTRACRLVVRARERASGVGDYQPQVPERKFKSHPGVPPARLTEFSEGLKSKTNKPGATWHREFLNLMS